MESFWRFVSTRFDNELVDVAVNAACTVASPNVAFTNRKGDKEWTTTGDFFGDPTFCMAVSYHEGVYLRASAAYSAGEKSCLPWNGTVAEGVDG